MPAPAPVSLAVTLLLAVGAGWTWPLPVASGRPVVVRAYAPGAQRWSAGNRGVDLAAAAGSPVLAPSAGVVVFAGPVAGRPVLVVRSPSGLRSTLEPVTAAVIVGDAVVAGQVVGSVAPGSARCPPASCLHWGVVVGRGRATSYRDPVALVVGRPVLLPLAGTHRAG